MVISTERLIDAERSGMELTQHFFEEINPGETIRFGEGEFIIRNLILIDTDDITFKGQKGDDLRCTKWIFKEDGQIYFLKSSNVLMDITFVDQREQGLSPLISVGSQGRGFFVSGCSFHYTRVCLKLQGKSFFISENEFIHQGDNSIEQHTSLMIVGCSGVSCIRENKFISKGNNKQRCVYITGENSYSRYEGMLSICQNETDFSSQHFLLMDDFSGDPGKFFLDVRSNLIRSPRVITFYLTSPKSLHVLGDVLISRNQMSVAPDGIVFLDTDIIPHYDITPCDSYIFSFYENNVESTIMATDRSVISKNLITVRREKQSPPVWLKKIFRILPEDPIYDIDINVYWNELLTLESGQEIRIHDHEYHDQVHVIGSRSHVLKSSRNGDMGIHLTQAGVTLYGDEFPFPKTGLENFFFPYAFYFRTFEINKNVHEPVIITYDKDERIPEDVITMTLFQYTNGKLTAMEKNITRQSSAGQFVLDASDLEGGRYVIGFMGKPSSHVNSLKNAGSSSNIVFYMITGIVLLILILTAFRRMYHPPKK